MKYCFLWFLVVINVGTTFGEYYHHNHGHASGDTPLVFETPMSFPKPRAPPPPKPIDFADSDIPASGGSSDTPLHFIETAGSVVERKGRARYFITERHVSVSVHNPDNVGAGAGGVASSSFSIPSRSGFVVLHSNDERLHFHIYLTSDTFYKYIKGLICWHLIFPSPSRGVIINTPFVENGVGMYLHVAVTFIDVVSRMQVHMGRSIHLDDIALRIDVSPFEITDSMEMIVPRAISPIVASAQSDLRRPLKHKSSVVGERESKIYQTISVLFVNLVGGSMVYPDQHPFVYADIQVRFGGSTDMLIHYSKTQQPDKFKRIAELHSHVHPEINADKTMVISKMLSLTYIRNDINTKQSSLLLSVAKYYPRRPSGTIFVTVCSRDMAKKMDNYTNQQKSSFSPQNKDEVESLPNISQQQQEKPTKNKKEDTIPLPVSLPSIPEVDLGLPDLVKREITATTADSGSDASASSCPPIVTDPSSNITEPSQITLITVSQHLVTDISEVSSKQDTGMQEWPALYVSLNPKVQSAVKLSNSWSTPKEITDIKQVTEDVKLEVPKMAVGFWTWKYITTSGYSELKPRALIFPSTSSLTGDRIVSLQIWTSHEDSTLAELEAPFSISSTRRVKGRYPSPTIRRAVRPVLINIFYQLHGNGYRSSVYFIARNSIRTLKSSKSKTSGISPAIYFMDTSESAEVLVKETISVVEEVVASTENPPEVKLTSRIQSQLEVLQRHTHLSQLEIDSRISTAAVPHTAQKVTSTWLMYQEPLLVSLWNLISDKRHHRLKESLVVYKYVKTTQPVVYISPQRRPEASEFLNTKQLGLFREIVMVQSYAPDVNNLLELVSVRPNVRRKRPFFFIHKIRMIRILNVMHFNVDNFFINNKTSFVGYKRVSHTKASKVHDLSLRKMRTLSTLLQEEVPMILKTDRKTSSSPAIQMTFEATRLAPLSSMLKSTMSKTYNQQEKYFLLLSCLPYLVCNKATETIVQDSRQQAPASDELNLVKRSLDPSSPDPTNGCTVYVSSSSLDRPTLWDSMDVGVKSIKPLKFAAVYPSYNKLYPYSSIFIFPRNELPTVTTIYPEHRLEKFSFMYIAPTPFTVLYGIGKPHKQRMSSAKLFTRRPRLQYPITAPYPPFHFSYITREDMLTPVFFRSTKIGTRLFRQPVNPVLITEPYPRVIRLGRELSDPPSITLTITTSVRTIRYDPYVPDNTKITRNTPESSAATKESPDPRTLMFPSPTNLPPFETTAAHRNSHRQFPSKITFTILPITYPSRRNPTNPFLSQMAWHFCPQPLVRYYLQKRGLVYGTSCIHCLDGPYYWRMTSPNFFVLWDSDNTIDVNLFFTFFNIYLGNAVDYPDRDIAEVNYKIRSSFYLSTLILHPLPLTLWWFSGNVDVRMTVAISPPITSTYEMVSEHYLSLVAFSTLSRLKLYPISVEQAGEPSERTDSIRYFLFKMKPLTTVLTYFEGPIKSSIQDNKMSQIVTLTFSQTYTKRRLRSLLFIEQTTVATLRTSQRSETGHQITENGSATRRAVWLRPIHEESRVSRTREWTGKEKAEEPRHSLYVIFLGRLAVSSKHIATTYKTKVEIVSFMVTIRRIPVDSFFNKLKLIDLITTYTTDDHPTFYSFSSLKADPLKSFLVDDENGSHQRPRISYQRIKRRQVNVSKFVFNTSTYKVKDLFHQTRITATTMRKLSKLAKVGETGKEVTIYKRNRDEVVKSKITHSWPSKFVKLSVHVISKRLTRYYSKRRVPSRGLEKVALRKYHHALLTASFSVSVASHQFNMVWGTKNNHKVHGIRRTSISVLKDTSLVEREFSEYEEIVLEYTFVKEEGHWMRRFTALHLRVMFQYESLERLSQVTSSITSDISLLGVNRRHQLDYIATDDSSIADRYVHTDHETKLKRIKSRAYSASIKETFLVGLKEVIQVSFPRLVIRIMTEPKHTKIKFITSTDVSFILGRNSKSRKLSLKISAIALKQSTAVMKEAVARFTQEFILVHIKDTDQNTGKVFVRSDVKESSKQLGSDLIHTRVHLMLKARSRTTEGHSKKLVEGRSVVNTLRFSNWRRHFVTTTIQSSLDVIRFAPSILILKTKGNDILILDKRIKRKVRVLNQKSQAMATENTKLDATSSTVQNFSPIRYRILIETRHTFSHIVDITIHTKLSLVLLRTVPGKAAASQRLERYSLTYDKYKIISAQTDRLTVHQVLIRMRAYSMLFLKSKSTHISLTEGKFSLTQFVIYCRQTYTTRPGHHLVIHTSRTVPGPTAAQLSWSRYKRYRLLEYNSHVRSITSLALTMKVVDVVHPLSFHVLHLLKTSPVNLKKVVHDHHLKTRVSMTTTYYSITTSDGEETGHSHSLMSHRTTNYEALILQEGSFIRAPQTVAHRHRHVSSYGRFVTHVVRKYLDYDRVTSSHRHVAVKLYLCGVYQKLGASKVEGLVLIGPITSFSQTVVVVMGKVIRFYEERRGLSPSEDSGVTSYHSAKHSFGYSLTRALKVVPFQFTLGRLPAEYPHLSSNSAPTLGYRFIFHTEVELLYSRPTSKVKEGTRVVFRTSFTTDPKKERHDIVKERTNHNLLIITKVIPDLKQTASFNLRKHKHRNSLVSHKEPLVGNHANSEYYATSESHSGKAFLSSRVDATNPDRDSSHVVKRRKVVMFTARATVGPGVSLEVITRHVPSSGTDSFLRASFTLGYSSPPQSSQPYRVEQHGHVTASEVKAAPLVGQGEFTEITHNEVSRVYPWKKSMQVSIHPVTGHAMTPWKLYTVRGFVRITDRPKLRGLRCFQDHHEDSYFTMAILGGLERQTRYHMVHYKIPPMETGAWNKEFGVSSDISVSEHTVNTLSRHSVVKTGLTSGDDISFNMDHRVKPSLTLRSSVTPVNTMTLEVVKCHDQPDIAENWHVQTPPLLPPRLTAEVDTSSTPPVIPHPAARGVSSYFQSELELCYECPAGIRSLKTIKWNYYPFAPTATCPGNDNDFIIKGCELAEAECIIEKYIFESFATNPRGVYIIRKSFNPNKV